MEVSAVCQLLAVCLVVESKKMGFTRMRLIMTSRSPENGV